MKSLMRLIASGIADVSTALDNLKEALPNLEIVS